jgi:predicted ArsR family transcriptional regulator
MSDFGDFTVYEIYETDKYELLAWVKSSERRVEILTELEDSPKNTRDFSDDWGVSTEAVRYHLKQLREGGPEGQYPALVKDLTPNRRQYTLYGLTESGVEIVDYL